MHPAAGGPNNARPQYMHSNKRRFAHLEAGAGVSAGKHHACLMLASASAPGERAQVTPACAAGLPCRARGVHGRRLPALQACMSPWSLPGSVERA